MRWYVAVMILWSESWAVLQHVRHCNESLYQSLTMMTSCYTELTVYSACVKWSTFLCHAGRQSRRSVDSTRARDRDIKHQTDTHTHTSHRLYRPELSLTCRCLWRHTSGQYLGNAVVSDCCRVTWPVIDSCMPRPLPNTSLAAWLHEWSCDVIISWSIYRNFGYYYYYYRGRHKHVLRC